MGTDRKRIILSLAALESLSIYGTVEVDRYLVAILDTSVLNSDKAGVFLSCALDLCLDIFLCNLRFCLLNFYALVLSKSNFRLNSYYCCVNESLAFLDLLDGNKRTGNDLKSALLCSIRIACVDTMEEYKKDLTEKLQAEKIEAAKTADEDKVVAKVIENATMEIPWLSSLRA